MTTWRHMNRRRWYRREFGGRWQDRVPVRFIDPRHGETVHDYCRRLGFTLDELARLSRKSGGDRVWRDVDDLGAWFREIGYISPFKPPLHPNCRCVTAFKIVEHALVTFRDFGDDQ